MSPIGSSTAHPLINLGELEFPEATDSSRRQAAFFYPAIDGVLDDAKMLGDVIH
jgi:hypothetical protein